MSRIITERLTITMHTDLEKLGQFRGATVDRKELLNDGRIVDAGQHALTPADVNEAIESINADAIAQLTAMTTERDTAISEKASLQTELDTANATIETLKARIDELTAVAEQPIATLSQIRVWLLRTLGVNAIKQVDAMIAAIPDELERAIAYQQWEYANNVLRDNPFVLLIADRLGLTPEEMDEAYLAATRVV